MNVVPANTAHHLQNPEFCMGYSYENLSSKLGNGYYVMQTLTGVISLNVLRRVYFANLHSQLQEPHTLWDDVKAKIKQLVTH